jgi:lysyl-tRNA synthetase class 2
MDEVADLVRLLLDRPGMPALRERYRDLFRDILDLDPWATDPDQLRTAACAARIPDAEHLDLDRDGWLDLLLTQCIVPRLRRDAMTFVRDYPPSQAALARRAMRNDGTDGAHVVAERFELYIDGVELANGFRELSDAAEQGARFAADLSERGRRGLPSVPPDDRLLAALASGLPASSGVALGLDRLLMVATQATHIDQVLAFPIERA